MNKTNPIGLNRLHITLFFGALWGAAPAVLEAVLFQRWYRAELRPSAMTLELVVNYVLYFAFAAAVLHVFAAAARKFRGLPKRADPARLAEALVGASVSIIIVNYLWAGPLIFKHSDRAVQAVLAAAVLAGFSFCVWVLYRLPRAARLALRAVLAVWIAAGLLWTPLFGRYEGVFAQRSGKNPEDSHPNIILIVTDTERADYLDCYGASRHASPATDRVAAEGALFLNHIAQSTWTLPSTASLLTGQFPSSHGAVSQGMPVSQTSPFLSEVLDRAGYRTGAFTENFHILPRNGFGRGIDKFWAVWLPWIYDQALFCRISRLLHLPAVSLTEKDAYPAVLTSPDQVNWDAPATTDLVLEWLNSLGAGPFYAYVHYMGPHGPYGPREFMLDAKPPAVSVIDHPRKKGGGMPLGEPGESVSADELETMKILYTADIMYVEKQIMRILDWLDEMNKADNTIVVLTSDHGEEFYDHQAWNHGGSAFNEVLRVPLVIKAAGIIKPGLRIKTCTRHIDILPTILDLAGLENPAGVQGRSLGGLAGGKAMDAVPAYTEVFPIRPAGCSIFSIVSPPYKLISVSLDGKTDYLLYDIDADYTERQNLVSSLPDVYADMVDEMDVWNDVAHLFNPDTEAIPIDPGTLKKLKSLGYVN